MRIALIALIVIVAIELVLRNALSDGPSWVSLLVIALSCASIAITVAFAEHEVADIEDLTAQEIAAEAEKKNFILYLRPFRLEGRLPTANPAYRKYGAASIPETVDFEKLVVGGAGRVARVIKIGGDQEDSGTGRVRYTDAEWQEHFERLSASAMAVVVIPGMGRGSIFELQSMKTRGVLSKCVFVLPKRDEHPLAWALAGMALGNIGVRLPDGRRGPTLFRINGLDEADYVTDTRHDPSPRIGDMVADAIADHAPQGSWRTWTVGRRLHRVIAGLGYVGGWVLLGGFVWWLWH
jgi:hypothetical protein